MDVFTDISHTRAIGSDNEYDIMVRGVKITPKLFYKNIDSARNMATDTWPFPLVGEILNLR